MSVLAKAFRRISPEEIVRELRGTGYLAIEGALADQAADSILHDVDDLEVHINRNVPPNVVHRGVTYANHVLARSKTAFDVVTDSHVTDILRQGLGEVFSMTGKRAYETRGGSYMCFHSDILKPMEEADRLDSIVFIFYLNDVVDGEWQIVEGSHLWPQIAPPSRAYDDELLARKDVTVSGFKMPKGSLLVYNGRLLHRAKPYAGGDWARRSFFFQVNRGHKKGEPILIETGFIGPDLSEDAKMLLGFGRPPRVPAFPETSAIHLPQDARALEDAVKALA